MRTGVRAGAAKGPKKAQGNLAESMPAAFQGKPGGADSPAAANRTKSGPPPARYRTNSGPVFAPNFSKPARSAA
jgi:hypothetical protein